jgi:hypothetical protein
MAWYVPLIALMVLAGVTTDDATTTPAADTAAADTAVDEPAAADEPAADAAADEPEPEAAEVDEPARDGQFTFRVKGIECGVHSVGDNEFLREEPQGQFCVLDVVVRNHDDRPGTLFAENLYLLDADGAEHSADWGATLAADPDGRTLSEEINPGNRVRGDVVFDVPEGVELTQARLHA